MYVCMYFWCDANCFYSWLFPSISRVLRGELFDDCELQLITKFMRLAIQIAATSVTSQKVKFFDFMCSSVHWRKRVIWKRQSTFSWPSIKPGTWNIPEHSGTFRNIPEHPGTSRNMKKLKYFFMKKWLIN